ncbi:MAG: DnaJ domain-containing protein [Dehalococcoidia bacterium]|nr:DnaJ domain-containing protein [Dehalococcoidia bacterium]
MARARAQQQDWYAVLGIEPGAGATEVKAAHRRLAREWHPDTNAAPEAHMRMREINRAREVLLDPVARGQFDRARRAEAAVEARRRTAQETPVHTIHIRATRPQAKPAGESAPTDQARQEPRGGRNSRGSYNAEPDFARDWYAFLGVSAQATAGEIRAAMGRKAMSMQGTPVSAVEVARRTAELRAAQATIGSPAARAAYDRARKNGRDPREKG